MPGGDFFVRRVHRFGCPAAIVTHGVDVKPPFCDGQSNWSDFGSYFDLVGVLSDYPSWVIGSNLEDNNDQVMIVSMG